MILNDRPQTDGTLFCNFLSEQSLIEQSLTNSEMIAVKLRSVADAQII